MPVRVSIAGKSHRPDLDRPLCLAVGLDFHGPQPRHFGAPTATADTLEQDGFVGDTRRGGSCNVHEVRLVPHCNGTHTECVGHIVDDRVAVHDVLLRTHHPAAVVTLAPTPAREADETYRPPPDPDDLMVTGAALEGALGGVPDDALAAVVIRTLPNPPEKRFSDHGAGKAAPYLSVEAVRDLTARGVRHPLVDFPSLDRTQDEGLQTAHHLFWNVAEGGHALSAETRTEKTVTEMIYVPDEVEDGLYLLDLQIAPFLSDAAPSRPLLFPLEPL